MKHWLDLIDGSQVEAESTVTISAMRKMNFGGSGRALFCLMVEDFNPLAMIENTDLLVRAVYTAYLNANHEEPLTPEEFEEQVIFDLVKFADICGEVLGGRIMKNKFSEEIAKATVKKKDA